MQTIVILKTIVDLLYDELCEPNTKQKLVTLEEATKEKDKLIAELYRETIKLENRLRAFENLKPDAAAAAAVAVVDTPVATEATTKMPVATETVPVTTEKPKRRKTKAEQPTAPKPKKNYKWKKTPEEMESSTKTVYEIGV